MHKRALVVVLFCAASLQAGLLDSIEHSVHSGDIVWPLLMSLMAGLLSALSPCVYPLIPITLAIMGTKRYESHLQGFLTALSYVFGMSLVYSALGAIFASIGMLFGTFMQHPVVIVSIAGLFGIMSLSMFGVLNIVIPQRLLTKLSTVGGQGKRGAFLMGMVAGLLAAPCTGPVLGFILTLIASDSDVVQGITLMLTFSLGMGSPFLVLGTFYSAVSRLPKSGPWMDNVKNIFGAIILGTAIYYLSLVWSPLLSTLKLIRSIGVTPLVVLLAASMLVLALHPKNSRALFVVKQLVGALCAAAAVAALLTFDDGKLSLEAVSQSDGDWHVIDAKTKDTSSFDRLLNEAKLRGLPVIIDFYADWCVACKQVDHLTLKNEAVLAELKRFFLIRVDATDSSSYVGDLENRFRVIGLPTMVFVDKHGALREERVLGFITPERLLPLLKAIAP